MRRFVTAGVVTWLALGVWGCSGNDYASGGAASPSSPTPSPTAVVTINVVAIKGAQSFSPNPAMLPAGQMIVWHNVDTTIHRVVLNDRSVDTGDLAPGASSPPLAIGSTGGQYHCSIHPDMVGSINRDISSPASPPCAKGYCN